VPKTSERDRYNLMERQAHQFAGALLLPAETFASDVRAPVTLDNLLVLKQRWGVSVAAMVMRLYALQILEEEEKLALFKRRSARWGSKAEPGDDKWQPEEPRLLRRAIELLVKEGVFPAEAIPRYLGFSAQDVEKLCCLPERYFANPGAVVELATLRRARERLESPKRGAETTGAVVPLFNRK
jgi:hypothetical protein